MTQQEITNYLTCDARTITEADIERVKKALKIAKIEKDITSARMKAGAYNGPCGPNGPNVTIELHHLFNEHKAHERKYNCLFSLLKYMEKVKELDKETAE